MSDTPQEKSVTQLRSFGFMFAHSGCSCWLVDYNEYKVLVLNSSWKEFLERTIVCSIALTLLKLVLSLHEIGRRVLPLRDYFKV